MSVYTKITSDEVSKYLEDYSIGLFESLEGISDGIENTNYILKTSKGEYIFTIFENIDINKVIQYLKLMNFLNELKHGNHENLIFTDTCVNYKIHIFLTTYDNFISFSQNKFFNKFFNFN